MDAIDADNIKPDVITKGHSFRVRREWSIKNIRKQCYSNRINSRKMLHAKVVSEASLNAFNSRLYRLVAVQLWDIANTWYRVAII